MRVATLLAVATVFALPSIPAVAAEEKSSPPARQVLFLAGNPSHGYGAHDHLAGSMLLSKSLNNSGLPIQSRVYHYGWPSEPALLERADCLVMYGDGGEGHMAMKHLDELDALA